LLLDEDGVLYRVDPEQRRLARAGHLQRPNHAALPHPGCSSWPQPSGDRYRACPGSITLIHGTAETTLIRGKHLAGGWGFAMPSPNGRTLLLEADEFGCGIYPRAAFLSKKGRSLRFPIPESSDGAIESEPLGWLHDGSALIAVQNDDGCEGTLKSGIHRAWPNQMRPPELILETSGTDATTWASEQGAPLD
jgi:hypothetical protein